MTSQSSTTFEAAALARWERLLYLLAAAFKITKSGKQSKISFYSLLSKQKLKSQQSTILILSGSYFDFKLFEQQDHERLLFLLWFSL